MNILIAIIGSSAFTTLLTVLFNLFQNKEQNSLSHITEERKYWREKIRTISEGIEKCEFNGRNKKNIEKLLVQLQMNINTYGKFSEYDYKQDGHIWKVMDNIKSAEDKKQFNIYKDLLIFYLSLMLKQDWEKSKREVSGNSNMIKVMFLYIIIIILFAVYYLGLWNSTNFPQFLAIVAIGSVCSLLIKPLFLDEIVNLADATTLKNLKVIRKRDVKIVVELLVFVFIIFSSSYLAYWLLNDSLCKNILSNMRYDINNNVLYTNFNKYIYPEFEEELTKVVEINVDNLNQNYNLEKISNMPNKYKEQITILIKEKIKLFNGIIISIYIAVVVLTAFIILAKQEKSKKYEELIRKANCFIVEGGYKQQLLEAYKINVDVLQLDKKNKKKQITELLALEYRILNSIKTEISNKTYHAQREINKIKEYYENEKYNNDLQVIGECLKIIKNIDAKNHYDSLKTIGEKLHCLQFSIDTSNGIF